MYIERSDRIQLDTFNIFFEIRKLLRFLSVFHPNLVDMSWPKGDFPKESNV
jgi:hypothetical protein